LPDPTPPRAAADARRVEVIDLGRAAYGDVLERMRARHAAVQRGEADGVVWLVEHEPVYTAGRATPAGDLRPGIVPIERGGKITYHGPGQLTVYPLVRLPRRDVRDWLRRLERFGVRIAARFGLAATPSVDGTGVFVGDRKFASIGVHVKGWVNLHGIGVNVAVARGAPLRPRARRVDRPVAGGRATDRHGRRRRRRRGRGFRAGRSGRCGMNRER
jgi:lipoyl(octanoyl) transferase